MMSLLISIGLIWVVISLIVWIIIEIQKRTQAGFEAAADELRTLEERIEHLEDRQNEAAQRINDLQS